MNEFFSSGKPQCERIIKEANLIFGQHELGNEVLKTMQSLLYKFLGYIENDENLLQPFKVVWDDEDNEPALELIWKDQYHDCMMVFLPNGYTCSWWIGINKEHVFAIGTGGEDISRTNSFMAMDDFVSLIIEGEQELNQYLKERKSNMKKLYFDMDGVLVDFKSGLAKQSEETKAKYKDDPDNIPGMFAQMDPIPGGLEAARKLATKYDCYILSTAPWHNPSAWGDKVAWITERAEDIFRKKVILTHHKGFLNDGESFLIDDRDKHGADEFGERHIQLWSDKFPDWDSVVDYLMNR